MRNAIGLSENIVAHLGHSCGVGDCSMDFVSLGDSMNGVPYTQIRTGTVLQPGRAFKSPNGRAELVMQSDGNLVVYDLSRPGYALWASNTPGHPGATAVMQVDGNFVVYDKNRRPLWATGTNKYSGSWAAIQDDGNFVVYIGSKPTWASGTNGFRKNFGVHGLGESISGVGITHLNPGWTLNAGQSVRSPNGRLQVAMQPDGNFVVYDSHGGIPLWASNTNGKGGVRVTMQPDGNLVVYNKANQPLWASGTDRHPGAFLAIQDDGNMVVYAPGNHPLWASGTDGYKKHFMGGGGDIFSDIGHAATQAVNTANNAVTNAVHAVSKATGLPGDQALAIAKNAAHEAQKAIASSANLVAKAGGDVGKFVQQRAEALAKDPLGSAVKLATTGPLALVGDPDDILKAVGIPTPTEIMQKVGIPPFTIPSPEEVANGITDPQKLLSHIPGLSEVSKFLPTAPNPQMFTNQIVAAASSGDPDKIKGAIIDVGHHVTDSLSMVPGVGNVLAGPLAAAVSALESGSPLRTALELLLSQAPIPQDIKDVVLRPAIHGISDIVEKHANVQDAVISSFKEGIMTEIQKRNLPDPAPKLIGDLIDAMVQVILQHKPLDQAAVGFAKKGLDTAIAEAKKKYGVDIPTTPQAALQAAGLPSSPQAALQAAGLPTSPQAAAQQIAQAAGVPTSPQAAAQAAGLPTAIPALPTIPSGVPVLPAGLGDDGGKAATIAKIASLQKAYNNLKDIGARSNEIYGLTQAIIKLNQQDPSKKNPAVQKQIKDIQTSIQARRLHIQANNKQLDSNLGKREPSHIAPAAAKLPQSTFVRTVDTTITDTSTPATAQAIAPTPAAATSTPTAPATPSAPTSVYGPYPHGLNGPPHGGGGHHGGGHGGGGRPFRFASTRGGWVGPWSGPWIGPSIAIEPGCSTWNSPTPVTPDLAVIGNRLLAGSGGRPTSGYHNGMLYLFSLENGEMTARPCAIQSVGALGGGC